MSVRPGGVTIIVVIFLIGAAVTLTFGIICAFMPKFASDFWNANIGPLVDWIPIIGEKLLELDPIWFQILGFILLPFGALDIITSYGLLKLNKWGYWLCFIISILLIVVILGIILIWYLRKDEIKAAFDIS